MEIVRKNANSSIPLNQIRVKDEFFMKYVKLVKDVIIPYQWDILNDRIEDVETSHCIENFRIAAGESEGEFYGAVFQDTDVAKWLEAVGFVLSCERDPELEALADETIELIGRAQQKDGYINTYFTIKEPRYRWRNLAEGHELYTAGHLIEAAVAYYEATGKDRFLKIVMRFANLICAIFGPCEGRIHGYPGHQEIELALVKLYRVTGQRRYLETARYFIESRGQGENYFLNEMKAPGYKRIFPEFADYDPKYSQSHIPVRLQTTAEGHAVRATYMYCAMADIAYECQDAQLLNCCEILWKDMVEKRMYITGSIGSSGILERFTTDYDLPNDRNYSETCASIGLALFGKRMADIEKDAHYMDTVELALYNTLLSGIALDGKSFFYVNPLEVWPENCMDHTSMAHVKPVRQKWFGVACCPTNIARTLASLGQYIYFHETDSIYVNLYIANETTTELNGVPVKLNLEGRFPWESTMHLKLEAEEETEGTIALRIPEYATDFKLYMNGVQLTDHSTDHKSDKSGKSIADSKLQEGCGSITDCMTDIAAESMTEHKVGKGCTELMEYKIDKGYAYITGTFTRNDITIEFSMAPQLMHANPKVRADAGRTAIKEGPLVYCLEEADNGENLASLYINSNTSLEKTFDPNLFGGTNTIHLKGRKIIQDNWVEGSLYQSREVKMEDTEITAVPYCYWNNRAAGEMQVWTRESIG